jgi:hypothetical protein
MSTPQERTGLSTLLDIITLALLSSADEILIQNTRDTASAWRLHFDLLRTWMHAGSNLHTTPRGAIPHYLLLVVSLVYNYSNLVTFTCAPTLLFTYISTENIISTHGLVKKYFFLKTLYEYYDTVYKKFD